MIPENIWMNKNVWINMMMVNGSEKVNRVEFRKLVDSLSTKETQLLQKNPDLIDRVKAISLMEKEALSAVVKRDFSLEVTDCQNGDVWIGTDDVEDCAPQWSKAFLPYNGWYLTYARDDNEFVPWARNFLFQEVRINLWLRYQEHKLEEFLKERKKKDDTPTQEELDLALGFGNYL